MSYADDVEELIADESPTVKAAIRAALAVIEEDNGPEPDEAIKTLAKLGLGAAKGSVPAAGAIIEGIVALITLARTLNANRTRKIAKSRKEGTAAGLSAYVSNKAASERASAQNTAQGAAKALETGRRALASKRKPVRPKLP